MSLLKSARLRESLASEANRLLRSKQSTETGQPTPELVTTRWSGFHVPEERASKLTKRAASEALGSVIYAGRALEGLIKPDTRSLGCIDGLIKIGFTTHFYGRMHYWGPKFELLTFLPGTLQLEAQLHDQFKATCAKGREWFNESVELDDWIDWYRVRLGLSPMSRNL